MKVLCAYTRLHPATEQALKRYVPSSWLTLVDISGRAVTGYAEEIEKLWTGEDDLVVIEHDIVIHDQVLPSFVHCSRFWCTFAFYFRPDHILLNQSLGCAKFSAELQSKAPFSFLAGDKDWVHLDTQIANQLKASARLNAHVHGEVAHLHNENHEQGESSCRTCEVSGTDASCLFLRLPPSPKSTESPRAFRSGR